MVFTVLSQVFCAKLIGDSLVFFSSPGDIPITPIATLFGSRVIPLDQDSFCYLLRHDSGRTFTYNTDFKSNCSGARNHFYPTRSRIFVDVSLNVPLHSSMFPRRKSFFNFSICCPSPCTWHGRQPHKPWLECWGLISVYWRSFFSRRKRWSPFRKWYHLWKGWL